MDTTGIRILCGLPHNEGRPTLNSIAQARFEKILPTLAELEGDYVYDGSRCSPPNVADRYSGNAFRKNFRQPWRGWLGKLHYVWACLSTWLGWQDKKIEATWHERASAEHWYLYEKDWD